MAGAWIKLRHDLCDAPEIRRLARACGVTRDDVLGKLFRLWSWFDRHSIDGMVADETSDLVDELVGLSGFAAALVSVRLGLLKTSLELSFRIGIGTTQRPQNSGRFPLKDSKNTGKNASVTVA
jgi:hypothetical protein